MLDLEIRFPLSPGFVIAVFPLKYFGQALVPYMV